MLAKCSWVILAYREACGFSGTLGPGRFDSRSFNARPPGSSPLFYLLNGFPSNALARVKKHPPLKGHYCVSLAAHDETKLTFFAGAFIRRYRASFIVLSFSSTPFFRVLPCFSFVASSRKNLCDSENTALVRAPSLTSLSALKWNSLFAPRRPAKRKTSMSKK